MRSRNLFTLQGTLDAPRVLLRLARQRINGDVADIAFGAQHDELIEKLAALIAKARMNDLPAGARLYHLVNDIAGKQGVLLDDRRRRGPRQAVRLGCLTAAVNKRPATAATAASLMTRRMAPRFRCSSLK